MTPNQQRFQELLEQLENVADELNNFFEEEGNEDAESAMMGLRMAVDEISELEFE